MANCSRELGALSEMTPFLIMVFVFWPWPMASCSRELRTLQEMTPGAVEEAESRDDDGTGPEASWKLLLRGVWGGRAQDNIA